MQISIENPERLDDFVGFLRRGGCIALRLNESTVEALVPEVASPLSERRELGAYLRSWQAASWHGRCHAGGQSGLRSRLVGSSTQVNHLLGDGSSDPGRARCQ